MTNNSGKKIWYKNISIYVKPPTDLLINTVKLIVLVIFFVLFIATSVNACSRPTCPDDTECPETDVCGYRNQTTGSKFCLSRCSSDADCDEFRRCDIDRCVSKKYQARTIY
ncbi:Kazal-like domain-containing protein [Caenorhabditis elegans]|uniref:Kazal-like domain-containing protein n=1 Tax=Caenorhabditis elegans TaxID=6239 RepID=A8WJ48_CAEEL|nr:Kazal-like domain-containing protein [Caenorhabditis elegans]CCD73262.1 Kazal-like domain-containing protein [Caenorhabditis elegans]|eukprot:NP_001122719.1 Uncharacterized protein CELE_T12B5.14 [Caenorhabditis elegans]